MLRSITLSPSAPDAAVAGGSARCSIIPGGVFIAARPPLMSPQTGNQTTTLVTTCQEANSPAAHITHLVASCRCSRGIVSGNPYRGISCQSKTMKVSCRLSKQASGCRNVATQLSRLRCQAIFYPELPSAGVSCPRDDAKHESLGVPHADALPRIARRMPNMSSVRSTGNHGIP